MADAHNAIERSARDRLDKLYGDITDDLAEAERLISKAMDRARAGNAEPRMIELLELLWEAWGSPHLLITNLYLANAKRLEDIGGEPR